jgi:hypothetical protein
MVVALGIRLSRGTGRQNIGTKVWGGAAGFQIPTPWAQLGVGWFSRRDFAAGFFAGDARARAGPMPGSLTMTGCRVATRGLAGFGGFGGFGLPLPGPSQGNVTNSSKTLTPSREDG